MLRSHPSQTCLHADAPLSCICVHVCLSVCLFVCLSGVAFANGVSYLLVFVCFRPVPSFVALKGCNTFLQKASSMPALTSTVGRLGGEMMVKQVGDMARGSSGASEVEKGYLEAPYTQVIYFFIGFSP